VLDALRYGDNYHMFVCIYETDLVWIC